MKRICANVRSLTEAIDLLRSASVIVFKCQGPHLGNVGGSLSLISFRVVEPESPITHLIDIVKFTDVELLPLLNIIQSPSPTKVVFDGRQDSSEFYHRYHVSIDGVLDLQLADVYSRSRRGEGLQDQLLRLSPYLNDRELSVQGGCYSMVQKLCTLDECCVEHGIVESAREVKQQTWTNSKQNNRYASRTIDLIARLYVHFNHQNYMSAQLPSQSARYASIWHDARPQTKDDFKHHPLLPLQILGYKHPTRRCKGCQRELPATAYSKSKQYCWVCRAIHMRSQTTVAKPNTRPRKCTRSYTKQARTAGFDSDDWYSSDNSRTGERLAYGKGYLAMMNSNSYSSGSYDFNSDPYKDLDDYLSEKFAYDY